MTPSTDPVFFIDWCIGKTVSNALVEAGAHIEHNGDHFKQDTPDTDWLPVLGDRGWVVLTKDKAIAKNQLELVATPVPESRSSSLYQGTLPVRKWQTYLLMF